MTFNNDLAKIDIMLKERLNLLLKCVIPAFAWAMFTLVIMLQNIAEHNFVLLFTLCCGLLSLLIGILIGKKKVSNDFNEYLLDIEPDSITIKSKYLKNVIKTSTITKITQNEKGIIGINTINRKSYYISGYLKNLDQVKEHLQEIRNIEYVTSKKHLYQYLYLVFFCSLFLIRYFPDYRAYLIIGSGFVISSIVNIVQLLQSQIKKRYIMSTLIVNAILIVIVIRNIYLIVEKLIKLS